MARFGEFKIGGKRRIINIDHVRAIEERDTMSEGQAETLICVGEDLWYQVPMSVEEVAKEFGFVPVTSGVKQREDGDLMPTAR